MSDSDANRLSARIAAEERKMAQAVNKVIYPLGREHYIREFERKFGLPYRP